MKINKISLTIFLFLASLSFAAMDNGALIGGCNCSFFGNMTAYNDVNLSGEFQVAILNGSWLTNVSGLYILDEQNTLIGNATFADFYGVYFDGITENGTPVVLLNESFFGIFIGNFSGDFYENALPVIPPLPPSEPEVTYPPPSDDESEIQRVMAIEYGAQICPNEIIGLRYYDVRNLEGIENVEVRLIEDRTSLMMREGITDEEGLIFFDMSGLANAIYRSQTRQIENYMRVNEVAFVYSECEKIQATPFEPFFPIDRADEILLPPQPTNLTEPIQHGNGGVVDIGTPEEREHVIRGEEIHYPPAVEPRINLGLIVGVVIVIAVILAAIYVFIIKGGEGTGKRTSRS